MRAWVGLTVHHTTTHKTRQGPSLAFRCWPVMSKMMLYPLKEWLTFSANSPSHRPYALLPPSLPSATASHCCESVRVSGPLRPSIRKRRGWRSLRRAQGSKHYVRSSGTPMWLWDSSTDRPLFLLKLSFHSPEQRDSCAGVQWQGSGVGSGRPSDFKDIDRHFSIVKSLVTHLTTRTGHPDPPNAISKVNDPGGLLTNSHFWNRGS